MTTIVVPYRDRANHLAIFKDYLRNVNARIVVIEQSNDGRKFNRGKLLNIGFELFKADTSHFIFHDVDMLPADLSIYDNLHDCAHLAHYVSQFDYRWLGAEYFGGVNMFSKEVFERINGFSNEFYGWGGEDNELLIRCRLNGITPIYIKGTFESLGHKLNRENQTFRENWRKFKRANATTIERDGLNSLVYNIESRSDNHIIVQL